MTKDIETRALFVGCGGMARNHLRIILSEFTNTHIPVVCEPSDESFIETCKIFEENGRPFPHNEPDLEKLLLEYGQVLDAAFIVTPHSLHFHQVKRCLESGLDVIVEKPMVMTAQQAEVLIKTRDSTGKLLVVAFQGSLSPQVRKAVEILNSGKLGEVRNISGLMVQDWKARSEGKWRQDPSISGGGFLFDSGAHLLNTISDLAREDFTHVSAFFNNLNRPVEITAAILGKLRSGVLVSLNGCGDTYETAESDLRVYCTNGALKVDAWGKFLYQQTNKSEGWKSIPLPESKGVWEQFLLVRNGDLVNPSPPELGLRMARLWDAIKESASNDGQMISIDNVGH